MPLTTVLHHHAHASGLHAEHWQENKYRDEWLVFTWDGAGLGDDGTLWGGEALLGRPGHWRRYAGMRPFRLPGGERAGREPWRSALALCWESDLDWPAAPENIELLRHAWEKGLNAPQSSAAGRLFDAAAALIGLCREASFEGQGPMWLEACADTLQPPLLLPLTQDQEGIWRLDWAPLLPHLLDEGTSVAQRAGLLHTTLARAIIDQAEQARTEHGIIDIGLTGGVFQNRLLSELTRDGLAEKGFRVHLAEQLPCNDGGLCYGQIVEVSAEK
jgi:hydrogenase maturation protein HypF